MPSKKKAAPSKTVTADVSNPVPEEIAIRAYGFFLQRGCADGWDVDDWLQAERELLGEVKKKNPAGRKKPLEEVAVG